MWRAHGGNYLKFPFSESAGERQVRKPFDELGVVDRLELVLSAMDSGLLKRQPRLNAFERSHLPLNS